MFIAKNEQELKCPNCNGQLTIEDINDTIKDILWSLIYLNFKLGYL